MSQSPRRLYIDAVRYYSNQEKWTKARLLSKRLRVMIRLIALEDACQKLGVGAIPPRVLLTMRMLAGYENATSVRYYQHRFRKPVMPRQPGEEDKSDPLQTSSDTGGGSGDS